MENKFAGFLADVLLPGMRSAGTAHEAGIKAAAVAQAAIFSGIYLAIKQKRSIQPELDKIIYAWIYSQLALIIASYAVQ